MPERSEKRADELAVGDTLEIRGQLWTVGKAKVKGKRVRLKVESRRGKFADEVKASDTYTVVVDAPAPSARRDTVKRAGASDLGGLGLSGGVPASGPLHNSRGAQTRWAEPRDLEPPAEPSSSSPWSKVLKADRPAVEILSAKLLGVEVEGGKLVVPPVTDATLFGHLLTMHGMTYSGVTVAEAKAWAKANDPGGDVTAEQVIDALGYERAYTLHDELHKDLTKMPTIHWHRERAPR